VSKLERIDCPYCGSAESDLWAEELGFHVVRCRACALLFVNPRLPLAAIDSAVRTGAHGADAGGLHVASRRLRGKVVYYERAIGRIFADRWSAQRPVKWLDVGAGYGELIEAVTQLAPAGSWIEGLEPMQPKAEAARARGLRITQDYLRRDRDRVDVVSFVDVFSHLPDFGAFLDDVRAVLEPGGEVFMETGNLADLAERDEFPGELGVPDHLVFAGASHIRGYLERAGFEIVQLESRRIDGVVNLAKTIVKRVLGRPEQIRMPYTSRYRQLLVRARLRGPA
jgi:SAM-dependent methyltransferase